MKVFWSIIAVLVAAFGVLLVTGADEETDSTPSISEQREVGATIPGRDAASRVMPGGIATNADESADAEPERLAGTDMPAVPPATASENPDSAPPATDLAVTDLATTDLVATDRAAAVDASSTLAHQATPAGAPTQAAAPEAALSDEAGVEASVEASARARSQTPDQTPDQTNEDTPVETIADAIPGTDALPEGVAAATNDGDTDERDGETGPAESVTAIPAGHNEFHNSRHNERHSADENGQVPEAIAELLDAQDPSRPVADAGTPEDTPELAPRGNVKTTTLGSSHTVVGTGTAEDPLIVPWTVFRSAAVTYRPERGMDDLPRWTEDLNGKHVVVTGHTLAPIIAAETSELLIMQNMWDGCCLGVPPTPYDAIEVKMKAPLSMRQMQSLAYGSLRGVIRVDPYLHNQWLLGLYVLDDAEIATDG